MGGGDGMSSSAEMGMGSDMGGGGTAFVALTEAEAEAFIRSNRYVDQEGKPLAASAAPPFDEFNRMPICLRLIVDQRRIPEILVNCANCAMPIEVLWVRVNPGATRPFEIGAYAAGAMAGGAASASAEMSGESAAISAAPVMGDAESAPVQLGGSLLGAYGTESVPIEIYGWITLFNVVEPEKIKKETSQ